MIGIIIKALLILSGVSAIMLYLLILGADACKSETDKLREVEEEYEHWKNIQEY